MVRHYKKPLIALVVVVVIFAVALGGVLYTNKLRDDANRNLASQHLQSEAAKESFTDENGNPVTLTNYAGQPVIVTSWASWCPQCIDELATLNNQVEGAGIKVLAINRKESREVAGRYMLELPPLPNVTFILDSKDYYFNSLEGYAMPETIIYNKAGEIVFHGRGNSRPDELKVVIDGLKVAE